MPVKTIFNGQDFELTLYTGLELGTASLTKILYQKPSGAKGEWAAAIDGKSLRYNVTPAENNEAGYWEFEAKIILGGKTYFGTTPRLHILKNLS